MPTLQLSTVLLVLIVMLGPGPTSAAARDRSFTAVLQGLERDYDLKGKTLPGLWLAKVVMKFHPTGISKFDLVLFEKQNLCELAAASDLQSGLQRMLGTDWKVFVQMDAPKRSQRMLMFARPKGQRMDIFMFSVEKKEAVAFFARVNPKALQSMIENPSGRRIGKL